MNSTNASAFFGAPPAPPPALSYQQQQQQQQHHSSSDRPAATTHGGGGDDGGPSSSSTRPIISTMTTPHSASTPPPPHHHHSHYRQQQQKQQPSHHVAPPPPRHQAPSASGFGSGFEEDETEVFETLDLNCSSSNTSTSHHPTTFIGHTTTSSYAGVGTDTLGGNYSSSNTFAPPIPMGADNATKNNVSVVSSSSSGPENFSFHYPSNLPLASQALPPPNTHHHQQQQQQQQQDDDYNDNNKFRNDGTFEYEGGVALQTALNVFGSVASAAGGLAGGLLAAGGLSSSSSGNNNSNNNNTTSSSFNARMMGLGGGGKNIVGNVATWGGRIVDVVAPTASSATTTNTTTTTTSTATAATNTSKSTLGLVGGPAHRGGSPVVHSLPPQQQHVVKQQQQVHPQPPPPRPLPVYPPHHPPPPPVTPTMPYQQQHRRQSSVASNNSSEAHELFGAAPTISNATPVTTTTTTTAALAVIGGQPSTGSGDDDGGNGGEGETHGRGENANDFVASSASTSSYFNAPPTTATTNTPSSHTAPNFTTIPNNNAPPIPTAIMHNATTTITNVTTPTIPDSVQPIDTIIMDDSALVPKEHESRQRQLSHRLSSLEKATHDSSFQYADPLVGGVGIVAASTDHTQQGDGVLGWSDSGGVATTVSMMSAGASLSGPFPVTAKGEGDTVSEKKVTKLETPNTHAETTTQKRQQELHSSSTIISSSEQSSSVTTTHATGKILLPSPSKAIAARQHYLPLPPPLPARKKTPLTSNATIPGDHTVRLFPSGTMEKAMTTFRKPPPIPGGGSSGGGSNTSTPRFHVPSPRVSPRMSPMTSTSAPTPVAARGVGQDVVAGGGIQSVGGVGSTSFHSSLGEGTASVTTSPLARMPPAPAIPPPADVRQTIGVAPSQHEIEEANISPTVLIPDLIESTKPSGGVMLPPSPGVDELSNVATKLNESATVGREEPLLSKMDSPVPPPALGTSSVNFDDNVDWNSVANSMVKVEDAVHKVVVMAPPPPILPEAVAPRHDSVAAQSIMVAPSPANETPTETLTAIDPAVFYSSTSPPIYPSNQFPKTPSSRVTECDVMSDYQMQVCEEDFPDVLLPSDGSYADGDAISDDVEVEEKIVTNSSVPLPSAAMNFGVDNQIPQHQYTMQLPETPEYMVQPSTVIETDRLNSFQDVVTEDVVASSQNSGKIDTVQPLTSVTNVANQSDGKPQLLPDGWVECFDPNSGRVYFYNENDGASSWERPMIDVVPAGNGAAEDMGMDSADIDLPPTAAGEGEFTGEVDNAESFNQDFDGFHQGDVNEKEAEEEALPDGWEKVVDPNTDKVFYFNSTNGISSWDFPRQQEDEVKESTVDDQQLLSEMNENEQAGELTGVIPIADSDAAVIEVAEATVVSQSIQEVVKITTPSLISSVEEAIHTATSSEPECSVVKEVDPMPEGWIESCDQSTGDIFYYNETLGVSQWNRPSLANEKDAVNELSDGHLLNNVAVDVTPSGESTLPQSVNEEEPGDSLSDNALDQQLESSSTIHTEHITGSLLQADDDEVFAEPPEATSAYNQPNGFTEDTASILSFESLPTGWIEAIDDNTGLTYYYNEESNETSWDRPVASEIVSVENTVDVAVVKGEIEHIESSKDIVQDEAFVGASSADEGYGVQSTGILRKGDWTKVTDPDSGSVYYFNRDTNESSWTNPEEKAADAHPSEVVEDSISGEDAVEYVSDKYHKVVDDKNVPGEPTAFVEAIDEGWTQVDHPPPASSKDVVEIEGVIGSRHEASDDGRLPDGWLKMVDPNTAKVYYCNEFSGATSWTLPEPLHSEVIEDFKQVLEDENTPVPLEPEIDAADNSLVLDEVVGHVELDEINERFEVTEPCMTNISTPQESENSLLPEGWMLGTDPSSGEIYYFNESTGESSWDRPVIPSEGDVVEAMTDADDPPDPTPLTEKAGMLAEKVNRQLSDAPTPSDGSLLDGWVEVNDQSSLGTYYYNESLGETTWDRPVKTKQCAAAVVGSRADRSRPAHAIATFGFGGRLCVMIPQVAATLSGALTGIRDSTPTMRRGPVVIHRLCTLIPHDHVYSIPSPETPASPLVQTNEEEVLSYLKKKSTDPEDLLWNVIDIAAQNDGKLRSDKRSQEAIVDLLLASNTCRGANGGKKEEKGQIQQESSASNLTEVQDLLIRGKRESAVDEAITQENYALALLIASMCDRNTYRMTARRFADNMLPVGSPLHTVALLFSDNLKIPDDEELLDPYGKRVQKQSHWYDDEMYEDLGHSWKEQLVSILCNRKEKWEKVVLSLGDRLHQLGHYHAAHVCYLVSSSSFGSPSKDTTRLVLIGCDHRKYMNQLLMTPQSIQSFERTEAFEWARRRGNRNSHIPSLQPFKLRYAELLADVGREELARAYLLSIRSSIGLGVDNDKGKTSSGNTSSAIAKDVKFLEALEKLDDRICVSIGAERTSWVHSRKSKGSATSLALSSFVKSVLVKKAKTDEPVIDPGAIDNDDLSPREPGPSLPELNLPESGLPRQQIQEPREDIIVKSSLPDGEEKASIVKNNFDRGGLAVVDGSCGISKNDHQCPPSSAPPVFGGGAMTKDYIDMKSEDVSGKDAVPPTPPQVGKKDGGAKAPVSEPPRSAGWLSKFLRRDGESKATVADVGEEMQAYYDEKLKRWIFPGDDPAEVAKPLAPPPIVPKTPVAPAPSAPAAYNDPLAALMAPPPSRGLSTMKKGPSASGRYADPLASTGKRVGTSSAGDKKIPPTSPMMAVPPTFAVFQPKPTPS